MRAGERTAGEYQSGGGGHQSDWLEATGGDSLRSLEKKTTRESSSRLLYAECLNPAIFKCTFTSQNSSLSRPLGDDSNS